MSKEFNAPSVVLNEFKGFYLHPPLDISRPLRSSSDCNTETLEWFKQLCNGCEKHLDTVSFGLEIIRLCRDTAVDDESSLQSGLFELIGDSGFEAMLEIMANVAKIRVIVASDFENFMKKPASEVTTSMPTLLPPQPPADLSKLSANQRRKLEKKEKEYDQQVCCW